MAGEKKDFLEDGLTNLEAWGGLVVGVLVFALLLYLLYELGHSEIDFRVFTAFYICALAIIICIAALSDNSKNENRPKEEKSKLAQTIAIIATVLYLVILCIYMFRLMKDVKKILSEPISPPIRTRRR
jgi:multisubunit Na+/H+ antiporter MnhB subunit